MAKKCGVTLEQTRRILLGFPGVEEASSYGTPGFRVRGKFLARLRDNDETLVVKCGHVERDLRLQADPRTFFTMEHYRDYPTVLIRLGSVSAEDLKDVFEVAWRLQAGKRLLAEYDRSR